MGQSLFINMKFQLSDISNPKYSQIIPVDMITLAFSQGSVDSLRYLASYLKLRAIFSSNAGNIPKQYDENQLVSAVCGYSQKTASRHIKHLLDLGWLRRLKTGGLQLVSTSRIVSNFIKLPKYDCTYVDTDVLFGYDNKKSISFKQWACSVLEERFISIEYPDYTTDKKTGVKTKNDYTIWNISTKVKIALKKKDVKYSKSKDVYYVAVKRARKSKTLSTSTNKKIKKKFNKSFSEKVGKETKASYKPCCTAISAYMTEKSRMSISRYHKVGKQENKYSYKNQCISKVFSEFNSSDVRYMNEYYKETLGNDLKHGKFIIKRGKITLVDVTRRLVGLVPITRKKLNKFKVSSKIDFTISSDDIRFTDTLSPVSINGSIFKKITRDRKKQLNKSIFGEISSEIPF